MKAISRLNQPHVNSSYSADGSHFPELLWWNGSVNMGGCLRLPFPAQQPAGFSPSRGLLVLSLPFLSPSLVRFQSRQPPTSTPLFPSPPTPPHPTPPLCALSGHPPCLFRWNRRGNESSESTVNPFLGLFLHYCVNSPVFHLVVSLLWWWFVSIYGGSNHVWSFLLWDEKKICYIEDAAEDTSESQLVQIQHSEKDAPQLKIITVVYLMCSLGYLCMYDFTGKLLCQCLAEDTKSRGWIPPLFSL